jgi:hypothetical protein
MSTTNQSTDVAQPGGAITLPPGVTVGPGRETSQLNAANQLVQGMVFPISLATGSTSTVFIPYTLLDSNPAQVQALFEARINALTAIPGQG